MNNKESLNDTSISDVKTVSDKSIDEVTIEELFENYPEDGVRVVITFTKEDLWDILIADVCLKNNSGIFDHILNQVSLKKDGGPI